jgi:hypothetical protein
MGEKAVTSAATTPTATHAGGNVCNAVVTPSTIAAAACTIADCNNCSRRKHAKAFSEATGSSNRDVVVAKRCAISQLDGCDV